jgi:SAM-dependent methyltransferase
VPDEGYAAGFGLQWTVHRETQYDRATGDSMSRRRFFDETRWPTRLEGEVLIEAGSGSGRFTEHALSTGAVVLSIDYSHAVESNFALNGGHANLLLVQGDLFRMPFRDGAADRLFCFGVLQHTPDPRGALASLTRCVRPGGAVVADIYAKTFARYVLGTKYWVRPITRRVAPARLYRILSRYVEFMWPLARRISRVPKLGRILNWRLLIADYSDVFADDAVLRDWAKLDTFDMLAPRYDRPATARTVARWCDELGLVSVDIRRGYNGLEFRASRASA